MEVHTVDVVYTPSGDTYIPAPTHTHTHIWLGTPPTPTPHPHLNPSHLVVHGAVQLHAEKIHGSFGGLVRVDAAHINDG